MAISPGYGGEEWVRRSILGSTLDVVDPAGYPGALLIIYLQAISNILSMGDLLDRMAHLGLVSAGPLWDRQGRQGWGTDRSTS